MTGDNPPHDVWLQSREGNLDHSRKVVELISKVFPDKQVIYTLGNHESFPCNRFGYCSNVVVVVVVYAFVTVIVVYDIVTVIVVYAAVIVTVVVVVVFVIVVVVV